MIYWILAEIMHKYDDKDVDLTGLRTPSDKR